MIIPVAWDGIGRQHLPIRQCHELRRFLRLGLATELVVCLPGRGELIGANRDALLQLHTDAHGPKSLIQLPSSKEGQPFIGKRLGGAPQRQPCEDNQPFVDRGRHGWGSGSQEGAYPHEDAEESEAGEQTEACTAEMLLEFAPCGRGEAIVIAFQGVLQQVHICIARAYVNDQMPAVCPRPVAEFTLDEFRGIAVEIPVPKRGGIERIVCANS